MGIDVTVTTIHSKLAEVNSEAMVLLHSRGLQIDKGVQELAAQNEKQSGEIKELLSSNEELLRQLQELREENRFMRENSDRGYFYACVE